VTDSVEHTYERPVIKLDHILSWHIATNTTTAIRTSSTTNTGFARTLAAGGQS
jgi:hypothetical protein